MKPGKYADMSMSDYQASDAISGTDLVKIAQDGLERWHWQKSQPREVTRAMDVGSAAHLLLAEKFNGGDAAALVHVYNDGSSLTKGFKAYRATLKGEEIAVDADEMALAKRCADAVAASKECCRYLDDALIEHSFFSEDAETKLMRRCRPDFLNEKQRVSINIKTTLDASDYGFTRAVKDFGYDIQCVGYQDVLHSVYGESFTEIHILIEKSEEGPVRLAIRAIDDDTLDNARFISRRILEAVAKARTAQSFADPAPRLETCLIPAWARTNAEWLV
jgi:hypothetical protein